MMAVLVLMGCTDAMVGPETTAPNSRLIKATDNSTLQKENGTETTDNHNTNTRITQRYFEIFPLPDSLRPPGTPPPPFPPPASRIAQRYAEPFPLPDSLRLPSMPPPPPVSRISNRYKPIPIPPPDSTASGNGGSGSGNNGGS